MTDLLTEAVPALEWLGLKVGMWESEPRMWVGDESDIFLDRPDKYNAEARDLILDALENKDIKTCLTSAAPGMPKSYCLKLINSPKGGHSTFVAKTRTTAVLNAAIAAHKAVKEMEGRS